LACDWYQASVTSACMKWKTKPRAHVWWRGGENKTKDEWCILCSLYNGVSGRCVRIRDQCTACARSNGEMYMHSYHGGYPTISHTYIYIYTLGMLFFWNIYLRYVKVCIYTYFGYIYIRYVYPGYMYLRYAYFGYMYLGYAYFGYVWVGYMYLGYVYPWDA
jgi:hypothetical protein